MFHQYQKKYYNRSCVSDQKQESKKIKIINIFLTTILAATILLITNNISKAKSEDSGLLLSKTNSFQQEEADQSLEEDLDMGASELSQLSANSHRIVANGWPSTSPMWPSIQSSSSEQKQQMVIEPFIYADKPRSVDYSLLLSINDTVLNILKSRIKPMAIKLSFEYYFNYDLKLSALPAIKIEVDRKQYKHLEPNNQDIKAKMWIKFNELISITDPMQFSNHDWLKFSLVIRQSPSLVAIRHLMAEFLMTNDPTTTTSGSTPPQQQSTIPATLPAGTNIPNQSTPGVLPAPPVVIVDTNGQAVPNQVVQQQPVARAGQPIQYAPPPQQQQQLLQPPPPPQQQYIPQQQQQPQQFVQQPPQVAGDGDLQEPAASNILETSIKPVGPKKGGWGIWGKERRKRQTLSQQPSNTSGIDLKSPTDMSNNNNSSSIVLTCFRSDQCDWKADGSSELIQWSLARMPPSTDTVQSGYYYVSNRDNYGDASKLLRLSLNQTDSATIADQNADHCIELALYVTEKTYLKLYRLIKTSYNDINSNSLTPIEMFTKGNLLLTWAPTMTTEYLDINLTKSKQRTSLPKSRLLAIENDQNGWTLETICFGDFFSNPKECGSGNCYFGFEMETETSRLHKQLLQQQAQNDLKVLNKEEIESQKLNDDNLLNDKTSPEQVVGVALLKEYTLNIPIKSNKIKWLETWQRDEVEPGDSWKFYPKLDFEIGTNNVSLINLYDDTHYYIESDWLNVDYNLDLTGSLVVEMINFNETLLNSTSYLNLLDSLTSSAQNSIMYQNLENSNNNNNDLINYNSAGDNINVYSLKILTKLVDSNYDSIYTNNSTIDWKLKNMNDTQYNMGLPITEHILAARNNQLKKDSNDDGLFKIVIEFILQLNNWLLDNTTTTTTTANSGQITTTSLTTQLNQFFMNNSISYKLSLVNISISDRCFPNPCQYGICQQNGTGYEDWNCQCDDKHRGRRCDFGRWCNLAHVTPWQPTSLKDPRSGAIKTSTTNNNNNNAVGRQSKLIISDSITRITGKEYCQRKLGNGYKCTDIDLPLNDNLYTEEDKTFQCSCQDDYYLSDDSKCKQAHLCNSVLCPSIGMICDESKPFNRTQPCQCNERQDWYPNPNTNTLIEGNNNKCVRHQCMDIKRDCGFDAHICLPTLPGEKPICKCGPKFTLKTNDKGQKYCDSTACVLPTLNDCEQVCLKDNTNLEHPYTCACHPGYTLDQTDKRTCALPPKSKIVCKPGCQSDTQICTEAGCKCKQGFVGEGEVIVQKTLQSNQTNQRLVSNSTTSSAVIDYVQSVRCLNVCALTYAENKAEFEMVESVCPLGLCDPKTFQCRCSDPSSSALINTKYEPIYANSSLAGGDQDDDDNKKRLSPLCHLRRVCEPHSTSYKICRSQGAICVPDYTKSAMFDCICPPSTEKKFYGQATSSEFSCEPRCSSKKYDCLRKQAICKLVDKDQVRCDCLPGLMFDQHDQKCYLAKYSYAFNLIIVNRYYEPEAKFHKLLNTSNRNDLTELKKIKLYDLKNNQDDNNNQANDNEIKKKFHDQDSSQNNNQDNGNNDDDAVSEHHLSELVPQFHRQTTQEFSAKNNIQLKSIFIKDYNQCNITQVIPKSVIEDPYEHDIESYLSYIDQCNEKLHQNVRTYHLNSKLGEDLRQSLRQNLRDFTVTTNNSSCTETDSTGMFLNCTVYLQSNEPIPKETVEFVFNDCDKHGYQNDKYCWIKPRLLLKRTINNDNNMQSLMSNDKNSSLIVNELNFRQIVPCEIDNFCGLDAVSTRLDDKTSLCACKCPSDIEVIDVKDLEPRRLQQQQQQQQQHGNGFFISDEGDSSKYAIKEICAPRNHCGANSTYCLGKTGSVCQYDIRLGSKCNCVYPSYEDSFGKCVEVTFSQLDNTLIVIIILLGTGLIVSIAINLAAVARAKSFFGHSKQYPLNEFSSSTGNVPTGRHHQNNRSTGVPNPVFTND